MGSRLWVGASISLQRSPVPAVDGSSLPACGCCAAEFASQRTHGIVMY
ncbi:MAG TPA: hypothetical protein IGS53_03005 [Leptolyngbyaceae cyanobacterium M33_DOE_097]|nr:hypothetical protein [Leptolyngbyaceae cyanobacterium M33_DOE_097]